MSLSVNTVLANGVLVDSARGQGFIVGHSKVNNGDNPHYDVWLIKPYRGRKLWNAYGEEDWRSVKLIDAFPVDDPNIPHGIKMHLLSETKK